MKIGILGGSFNPPHNKHLAMGLDLVNKNYVDKIFYVPTGSKYKYKNNLVEDFHRLEMIKLMIDGYIELDVSDYELKDYVVYTCDTLAYFKKLYPNDEIYFICGTDNLTYMDKWMNGLDILSNYKIIVIKRNTDDIEEILRRFDKYKDNIIVTDILEEDLSSTLIRDSIKDNKNIEGLVPSRVLDYIRVNNLYK